MQAITAIMPRAGQLISSWIAPLSVFLICTGFRWLPVRGLFPKVAYPAVRSAILLCAFRTKQTLDWFRRS